MAAERDYVLGTHEEELARLGLQHRVWRPVGLDCWQRAGITVGNEHGLDAQRVISVDGAPHNQLHALAPKELQLRMHDYWPAFQILGKGNQERQSAKLNSIFPEGKSFVLTFAAPKETFPRQNSLAALASHPELKSRLLKEFSYAGEKIYEVYEIDRSPRGTAIHHVAP
jgi:hypothetical protein